MRSEPGAGTGASVALGVPESEAPSTVPWGLSVSASGGNILSKRLIVAGVYSSYIKVSRGLGVGGGEDRLVVDVGGDTVCISGRVWVQP